MNKYVKYAAIAALVSAATVPASVAGAATGDVPFNGTVSAECVVNVGSAGILTVNGTYDVLGSQQAGGAAGTATILATDASFSISADAPAAWDSSPAGGGTSVTFGANYSTSGATTIAQTNGTIATALNQGNTAVNVNMDGTKSAGIFPAGSYAATVVLRCE